jgi:hypothetical protein
MALNRKYPVTLEEKCIFEEGRKLSREESYRGKKVKKAKLD